LADRKGLIKSNSNYSLVSINWSLIRKPHIVVVVVVAVAAAAATATAVPVSHYGAIDVTRDKIERQNTVISLNFQQKLAQDLRQKKTVICLK